MTNSKLTDELRRFIQSIESIPHLEAMLLMHQGSKQIWTEKIIAEGLYLRPDIASNMLADLCAAGFCLPDPANDGYVYQPSAELAALVDQLAIYYSHHLIEVTNMVHTKNDMNRRARLFADAFIFKKED